MDVELDKIGTESPVSPALPLKTGTLLLDHVDAPLDLTGTELAALVATEEESGTQPQIHAFAQQETGMDSLVLHALPVKLGVPLPYHARAQPIPIGTD